MHDCHDLMQLFNDCFAHTHNTRLVKGDDEPLYMPAHAACPYHAIVFAHGFFSSALHECAHWFIAGKARRQQVDYGYWYVAEGRTALQQRDFQRVEIKPQALECILSQLVDYPFHLSFDAVNSEAVDRTAFAQAVQQQVWSYQHNGLPLRAQRFAMALTAFYHKRT